MCAPDTAIIIKEITIQEIAMAVTRWAMKLAPAVFGVDVLGVTSKSQIDTIMGLSCFMLTVMLGLHSYVEYIPLFCCLLPESISGISSLTQRCFAASLLYCGSSAAVMPLTIKTAEEKWVYIPLSAGSLFR